MITRISKSDAEIAYKSLQKLRTMTRTKIVWSRDNIWLADVYDSIHYVVDLRLPLETQIKAGNEK